MPIAVEPEKLHLRNSRQEPRWHQSTVKPGQFVW